jgi:predicted neutral ceramidase superfamily lipid hydrolase
MINHKNNTDDFFKDFIQKAEIESPSADFTSRVMQKINEVAPEPSLSSKLIKHIKSWYFIAMAFIFGIAYTLYYFTDGKWELVATDFDPVIFPIFKKIFVSLTGLFHSIQISSFTIVVILSIAALFIIDRLLNKFRTGRQTYFSF